MENSEKNAESVPVDGLETKYEEVKARLQSERLTYLRAKFLYSSLHNVIEGDQGGNVEEDEMITEISESTMRAEMNCCVQMLPNAIKKKESAISSEAQAFLFGKIKDELESKCKNLLTFYEDKTPESYPNKTVFEAKSLHVGELLEEERKNFQMLQHEMEDLQSHENSLLVSCLKELINSAEILVNILNKFKLNLQPQVDEAKLNNLVSQCELVIMKATSTVWNLKKELYHKHSIPALKVIQKELVRARNKKLEETTAIEEKLYDFKILGDEFGSIVAEYGQILQKIEKREWTLNKLTSE